MVYHREEIDGLKRQKVEIHYKLIGHINLPKMSKSQRESFLESFGREQSIKIA